ncbi:MAG: serine hydrolase domain-containing protein [Hyphomonas sp.]
MGRTRAIRSGLLSAGAGLWLAACAGMPAPALTAEPASVAVPVDAPAFDEAAIAALEARMAAYIDEGRVKGIATRLIQDGEVISDMRAGIRREADGAPVTEDTIWRIYSMSKPVTGVALLMLWEEGRFDLDDPVTKYFPEFEGLKVFTGLDEAGQPVLVPVERPPTVQELMSHTAGFGYGLAPANYIDDQFRAAEIFQSPDADEMIHRVSAIPLKHPPGQVWDYSISVDIQGALIERLSGQTLGEFFRTSLFEPLGMKDSGFFVPEAEYDRFSDVWGRNPETGGLGGPLTAPGFQYHEGAIAFEGGGHGLVATMDDYARFATMLANGGTLGNVQILKPETVDMMRSNFLPPGQYVWHDGTAPARLTQVGFGLNVAVTLREDAPYPKDSYMWGGAAGTWFWIDPTNKLAFIGMIQVFGGALDQQMRIESAELVYQALRGEE